MSSSLPKTPQQPRSPRSEESAPPSTFYYCRVGRQGFIGRFRNASGKSFNRGSEVVLRTARGIEIGAVVRPIQDVDLATCESADEISKSGDGTILRGLTEEDRLLSRELDNAGREAFEACRRFLTSHGLTDSLLDVETLLDAKTLYFYFLGEPNAAVEAETQRLANLFSASVAESRFGRLLETGCGPDCGSELKGGCGSGGTCATCIVASACKK